MRQWTLNFLATVVITVGGSSLIAPVPVSATAVCGPKCGGTAVCKYDAETGDCCASDQDSDACDDFEENHPAAE